MRIRVCFLLLTLFIAEACTTPPTSPEPEEEGGILQINSSPSGAEIWLNGSNTGKVTNAVLTNVSPGTHTLKLIREGYQDYEQKVTVSPRTTVQVNAVLSGYKITITSPTSSSLWVAQKKGTIRWSTSPVLAEAGEAVRRQGLTNVQLDLYEDSGWKMGIISSTPNSGQYEWTIPKEVGGGREYRVRVSIPGQSNHADSEAFSICYNVEGTYQGTITITQGSNSQTIPVTYVQSQDGKNVTGTWTATPYSGTVTGTISQSRISVLVTLQSTPPSQFAGTMDIENSGDRLRLVFSGYTSVGFLTAEFVVTRI